MWIPPERVILAINGDYRSNGWTCSDEHETKKTFKNRHLTMIISRMHRHVPFGPTDPNFRMWGGVTGVINSAKFFENRFRGFGTGRPRKMAFPIESVHRPSNSAALPVINYTANMDDGRELWATKYWIHIEDTHCGHSQQTHIVDTHNVETYWGNTLQTYIVD